MNASDATTNPQIEKLIREKQHKTSVLEECAQKVKGFKIAGISTIGLTVAGVTGNVLLAEKRKDLEQKVDDERRNLKIEEAKLIKVKRQIRQAQKNDLDEKQKLEAQSSQVKEGFIKAEDIINNIPALKECPGNAWEKINQHCPACANEVVRKNVCFYDVVEERGVYGFETSVDGAGTWLYHVPQEDIYEFVAILMDDCFCDEIIKIEEQRKKEKEPKK